MHDNKATLMIHVLFEIILKFYGFYQFLIKNKPYSPSHREILKRQLLSLTIN